MLPDAYAVDVLRLMYTKYPANQEALHRMAYDVRSALKKAENQLSELLTGSHEYRAVAFPGGTSAIALLGKWKRLRNKRVLTTSMEHPSVNHALKSADAKCIRIPNGNDGRLLLDNLPDADAVFVHHVQSEIGVIQDLDTLFSGYPDAIKIADTIQSAVKMPLPRSADVLTVSGAKFGIPGAAALLVKKEYAKEIEELSENERNEYRTSRLLIPNFLAMSEVAAQRVKEMRADFDHVSSLQKLCRQLAEKNGLHCTLPAECSSPYICHISLENADGAVVVRLLGEEGICAGAGTACSAETGEPSAALRAIGYSKKAAFGGLRISFSPSTQENDVKKLFNVLEKILKNY